MNLFAGPEMRISMREMIFGRPGGRGSDKIELLKWIAVLTMLIDHVGYMFFPEDEAWRVIGRVAFPVFMILFAEGAMRTRDPRDHAIRLWLFAVIAQVPYTLYFDTYALNVLFTMLLTLMVIRTPSLFLLAGLLLYMMDFDYGWYGLLLGLLYALASHAGKKHHALFPAITLTFLYTLDVGWMWQIVAVVGILLTHLPELKLKKEMPRLPKSFFYLFYPLHLLVLFIIAIVVYG